jgi:signal transduction histidine kinase
VRLVLTAFELDNVILGALFVQDVSSVRAVEYTKDFLVGVLAHDMNNPLTAILGSVEFAARASTQADARPYLDTARDACTRMSSMVDNLFDVTRLETGAIPMKYSQADVNQMVQECVDGFSMAMSAKGVRVEWNLSSQSIEAEMDGELVRRALDNLVDNALRHSPTDGRIRIATQVLADTVQISVRDSGPGVPPSLRSRIFQPFVRSDSPEDQGRTHRGLGLALVDLVAREHGGSVTLECPDGGGSTFTLTLPVSQPKFDTPQEEAIERNRRCGLSGLDLYLDDSDEQSAV